LRRVCGTLLGVVAWLWLRTLRVTLEVDPRLIAAHASRPWVLSFFHGKLWPLLAWKRRGATAVMVSHSRDGELLAAALRVLGFSLVRGSSSRGGARALAGMTKQLRKGVDAAFAVDGPRGPSGVVKPGAAAAARATGAVIVPMGAAVAGGRVFFRSWDRFVLAWPFGRVAIVLAAPPLDPRESLDLAIARANERAEALLAARETYMVASRPVE